MLKKCALILLLLLPVLYFYLRVAKHTAPIILNQHTTPAEFNPVIINSAKKPSTWMQEEKMSHKLEAGWYEVQVNWLIKNKQNIEVVGALGIWQDELSNELDEHADQKPSIEKKFQIKLQEILGHKLALQYLQLKKEYYGKIN